MLYGEVIDLIADSIEQDKDGYISTNEIRTEVYADVKSATRSEFYNAMQSGLQASIVFVVSFHDYSREKIVDYDGRRFDVIRTYQTDPDHIELTCSEVIRQ